MAENIEISERKKDHLDLAEKSQFNGKHADSRFFYEPLMGHHPKPSNPLPPFQFLGKTMKAPIWVSSMTGGSDGVAETLNRRLAQVAGEFGLGMGLGSCRPLLEEGNRYWKDFDFRTEIGNEAPFFGNLGIAQIEYLLETKSIEKIFELSEKLKVDGLFIHINPLQEFFQPEGDLIKRPPLETLQELLEISKNESISFGVKEVGQGMGPKSLEALIELPVEVIEFGALGGTNFTKLEMIRHQGPKYQEFQGLEELIGVGHTADEMVDMASSILEKKERNGEKIGCQQFIISGGIQSFLHGYYLVQKLGHTSVYGQAKNFLFYAQKGIEELREFVGREVSGLALASQFLSVRS